MAEIEAAFPAKWVGPPTFEEVISECNPLGAAVSDVCLHFPDGCKLLINTVLKVLSLANQLATKRRSVRIRFDSSGPSTLMGYLDRMGFFGALDPNILVEPSPPTISAHGLHFGGNDGLIEIRRLDPNNRAQVNHLPGKLANEVMGVMRRRKSAKHLDKEIFTVFAELIGNFYDHSKSSIPGFLVAQTYDRSNSLIIAISDSGLGITATLRRDRPADFKNMSDAELLVQVFNEGVSRYGSKSGRGCGLYQCGKISIRHSADLWIRTPTDQVHLKPARTQLAPNMAYCQTQLGQLEGNHLAFEFTLDK